MATPPDFTTGAVLTAAQMSAIGLWEVKTQTIGTTVTSVVVTDAFSADYDSYKIVVTGTNVSSTGNSAFISLSGSTGSTYFAGGFWQAYTSSTLNGFNSNGVSGGTWIGITGGRWSCIIDVVNPFAALASSFMGQSSGGSFAATFQGHDTNAASSTGFTLTQVGGNNWTGGTIRVYGYRK
jgi:hypothetical protein